MEIKGMDSKGLEIKEYNILGIKQGSKQTTCPKCSEHRKPENRKAKCLSVFWDTGMAVCNHCGVTLQLHTYKKKQAIKTYTVPKIKPETLHVSDELGEYSLKIRSVSRSSLDALKIGTAKRWMPKAQKEIEVVEFPYFVNGVLVNVKYRGKNKDFAFEKDCEVVMFNLDNVMHESECVVVEGEWDALSFVEAGILNVTSVPNGFTLPRADGSSTINLSYLDNYWKYFENKSRIFLAVDNDDAGNHGKEELIRRFGAEKCWLVDLKDCKDANDYLKKYGKEALAKTIADAQPLPLENVVTLNDYRLDLENFYINGSPKGWECGLPALDSIYSIEPGQYTIVTGTPASGKSELVDSICIGYALKYGFKTAFASPENKPNMLHGDKILRKIAGYRPTTADQVGSIRIQSAMDFCGEHFFHLEFNEGYELSRILDKFTELVRRKGVKVFVIDPFNKTRLKSSASKNWNEYTADYLQEIDIFCRKTSSIVYLVAHPNKMKKIQGTNTYEMPTAYDIKGGGEMFDMAYHILGVCRNMEHGYVDVKTLKVKFQHLGKYEEHAFFKWNINNGRYVSVEDANKEVPGADWDNGPWVQYEKIDEIQPPAMESKIPADLVAGFESQYTSKRELEYTLEPDLSDPGF